MWDNQYDRQKEITFKENRITLPFLQKPRQIFGSIIKEAEQFCFYVCSENVPNNKNNKKMIIKIFYSNIR